MLSEGFYVNEKNPLTLVGIEPATFRFAAQYLNHCATAGPGPPPLVDSTSDYMDLLELYQFAITISNVGLQTVEYIQILFYIPLPLEVRATLHALQHSLTHV